MGISNQNLKFHFSLSLPFPKLQCLYASSGLGVWEVMRPGDAELDPQSPFKACFGCGKRMAEDASRRCIGEKMSLTLMPFKNGSCRGFGAQHVSRSSSYRQGVRVVARDSFCNYNSKNFFLGKIVDVVGFAGKNIRIWRDVGSQVEAISIQTTSKTPSDRRDDTALCDTLLLDRSQKFSRMASHTEMHRHRQRHRHRLVPSLSSDYDASQFSLFSNDDPISAYDTASSSLPPGFDRLPDSIHSLVSSSSSSPSPWRFTWTLAYSVAAGVAPLETFHRLKLTLLLALVMVQWDECGEEEEEQVSPRLYLDLLVCGMETQFIDRIMTYFGNLLPEKYVRHSVLSTPIVRVRKSVQF